MERSLLLASLTLSIVGFAVGFLSSRPPRSSSGNTSPLPNGLWVFAALVPVLLWLISFREKAPFSAGHGMGNGILLGGIAGWVAAKMLQPHSPPSGSTSGSGVRAMAGTFGLVGVLAIMPQIWQRGLLLDFLMGEALGFAAVVLILAVGSLALNHSGIFAARLTAALGYTATAIGFVVMGELRYPVSLAAKFQLVAWGVPGACLIAGIPIVLLVCALPSGVYARWAARLPFYRAIGSGFERMTVPGGDPQNAAGNALRLILAAILILVLGKFVAVKVVSNAFVFSAVRIGIVAGLLIVAILSFWKEENAARWMAPLVLVAAGILVFPALAGVGLAWMLLAAWTVPAIVIGCAEPSTNPNSESLSLHAFSLMQTFLFGTLFVLYRVCTARFNDDLSGLPLMDQNVLFATLAGVCLPSLLSSLALPARAKNYSVFALVVAGVVALCVPAAALLFWGAKSILALLIGLSLAVLVNPAFGSERRAAQSLIAGLFALCITLVLCQSYPNLLTLTDVSRDQAVGLVKWIFALGIALYLVAGLTQSNNEEAAQ